MSRLYTPLQIAEEMNQEAEKQRMQKGDYLHPIVRTLLDGETNELSHKQDLNLDDFISWVLGSTFFKKKSEKYTDFNRALLDFYKAMSKSYRECRKEFRQTIIFASIFRCWKKHKQAYRFDEDFIQELMKTKAVKIPTEVLKRLPFRCFYLDLEDTDWFNPYIGMFLYVGFDEITGLPNLAASLVENAVDSNSRYQFYTLHISGEEMKKWGILQIDENNEPYIQFQSNDALSARIGHGVVNTGDNAEITLFILQVILYLSSNKPDMEASPKQKIIYTGPKKKIRLEGDLSLLDVGVRYGAAIRKTKKELKAENEEVIIRTVSTKQRKPMTSHVRAAHWHHYWTGKGRTRRIVRWVPPTFVSGLGKELPVTIHKVHREN